MRLNASVFDVWVFRRAKSGVEFLLLHASQHKADKYFNGGRFWQIPSAVFRDDDGVLSAVDRTLSTYGLYARAVWAAEHAYTIYNRRFHEVQIITVYAAEVDADVPTVVLNPEEHGAFAWVPYEEALERVHFRGLKDGLRSVQEYVTSTDRPAAELQLR